VSGGAGRSALISGCSSGIGRATALRLERAGWSVHAGVRKDEDAEDLASEGGPGLHPLILDVTDPDSVAAAREAVGERSGGRLDALVNNAGVAYSGPLEFVSLEDLRSQLEVNLVAQVAMIQALLPALRLARGRIVNVTSIGGIVATPFFGPYNASKFGLEAIGDCLRVELRPWGIETIAIEPGSVDTGIWSKGTDNAQRMRERMDPEAERLYGEAMDAGARAAVETGQRGIPPDEAAKVIERALDARRPRPRYLVGRDAYGMATAARLLPARLYDRIVARALRLP
jgi:NAD(P)-dependent dehydrogenase (short-subunit alcohol dehydrogenase family)